VVAHSCFDVGGNDGLSSRSPQLHRCLQASQPLLLAHSRARASFLLSFSVRVSSNDGSTVPLITHMEETRYLQNQVSPPPPQPHTHTLTTHPPYLRPSMSACTCQYAPLAAARLPLGEMAHTHGHGHTDASACEIADTSTRPPDAPPCSHPPLPQIATLKDQLESAGKAERAARLQRERLFNRVDYLTEDMLASNKMGMGECDLCVRAESKGVSGHMWRVRVGVWGMPLGSPSFLPHVPSAPPLFRYLCFPRPPPPFPIFFPKLPPPFPKDNPTALLAELRSQNRELLEAVKLREDQIMALVKQNDLGWRRVTRTRVEMQRLKSATAQVRGLAAGSWVSRGCLPLHHQRSRLP
jgi:hypothetical protein